jgi:streptomycin 6-kinase
LDVAARPRAGDRALVLFGRRGEEPCALKVSWPDHSTAHEAAALRAWGGHGAVRLLEAAPDEAALLLERLTPDRSLEDLGLLRAAEVAGALIRQLAIPAPPGLPPLADQAERTAHDLSPRQARLGDPLPRTWVERAAGLARDLAATAGTALVHTDLHYGNVLAGPQRAWLAIDPRPVVGQPERSVPELLWWRLDPAARPASVRTLLDVLVDAGALDRDRARDWAIVRAVDYWLWGLEAGLTEDPVRCARILEALT